MTETKASKQAAGSPANVSLPRAEPEVVGMSSTRLSRIVTALNAEIEAGQLPGAVVAVARRGYLVFHEAVGHLGPDRTTSMPADAVFAIASMTKPVTGVAALLLWEEGRLGLADPVERFLPQLGNRRVAVLNERVLTGQGPIETVPAERSITIQDLMRHTSGLTYGGLGTTAVHPLYPASSNVAGATLDTAAFLEQLATAPLLYQPRTVWDYGFSPPRGRMRGNRSTPWRDPGQRLLPLGTVDRLSGSRARGRSPRARDPIPVRRSQCRIAPRRWFRMRRRGANVDRSRLSPLRANAARRWRPGQNPHPGSQNRGSDADQPNDPGHRKPNRGT